MAPENSQPQEVDLDRTDRLPILDGTLFDADVVDDAVRMEYAPAAPSIKSEFRKPAGVDPPMLAESGRSVEDRIARQGAEYEALRRSYDEARDAEAAAVARAQALAADLAGLRGMLESEQARSREIDKARAEKSAATEAMRARVETTLREADRYRSELRTLRDTIATRDATIVKVLHSLAERDAQLNALQREHAQIVPTLEERSRAGTQLEADLHAAQARYESMAVQLRNTQESVAAVTAQLNAGREELKSTRRELDVVKTQAASYLEHLRTREWRRGFDQNLFLELDAKIGAAQDDRGALQSEHDQLRARVIEIEAKLTEQIAALENERSRLNGEIARLQSEAQAREEEMTVLLAHLHEARRPLESIEGGTQRLTEESAARTRKIEQLNEDNRSLQAALERARGALEEREFLIRRLERSESNNANVLGRPQTNIERLGSPGGAVGNEAAPVECTAELVRTDGQHNTAHHLARRTRIGRAPGCELHIDSSSVSRHHALLLVSSRDAVIEDLNSTNGVIVNGRRISRQPLNDGDLLTIGEAQFRVNLKFAPRESETPAPQ